MAALTYTSASALKTRMGISDTNSDTILGAVATAVNEMVESYIGAPVGDMGHDIRYFDGSGSDRLWVRQGIRGGGGTAITLEISDGTNGAYKTLATSEYVLRPADHDRPTGWPAFYIILTDAATTYGVFTEGYDTVKIEPQQQKGGGWGWAAIPPDLSAVADIMGVRMFQSRQSGEMMVIGSTDFGGAIVRFLPEPEYRNVLDRYRNVISPPHAF